MHIQYVNRSLLSLNMISPLLLTYLVEARPHRGSFSLSHLGDDFIDSFQEVGGKLVTVERVKGVSLSTNSNCLMGILLLNGLFQRRVPILTSRVPCPTRPHRESNQSNCRRIWKTTRNLDIGKIMSLQTRKQVGIWEQLKG